MHDHHEFATRVIHAGWTPDQETGSIMPPVYLTSTYVQDAPAQTRNGYEYSRTQNPTRFALQDALAELEGGVAGFTFSSGMAAIQTLLLSLKSGDRVVAGNDLYGGTFRLFTKVAARFGLRFDFVDTSKAENLDAIPEDTRLLYLETPTNPLLRITDLERAVAAARRVGAEVAVDNTFATPALQRPLALGADYVLHSTTKYIGGHSDVVGGALVVKDPQKGEEAWFLQNSAGTANSPFDAFLTLRGLRTLDVRMERHCRSAMVLAHFLEDHSQVEKVHYPGLQSHPGHEVACRQMSGFGGMVGFELPGGEPQAREFVKHLKIFQLAESLGGVESLVELPAPMTHASIPAEERRKAGLADGLVRLSVGIEAVEDLRDALQTALKACA
ncbi:MAG: cystathionine gamma-synthase [Planctomycetota bacterium]|nr:MAG: cystathionine gamma-synthase [Planctomycetota bacterium]